MPNFVNNAIFWVEVEKVKPNPYQPRREFDEARLSELAESIRMYGVLQPLVVTRKEVQKEDGGLVVEYELISGERRLRATRLAGIAQVPVIIRHGEQNEREKLELAIIENLQREDLRSVDRAHAFERLVQEFGFKHADIGRKVGKSREYVTNTLRILDLSEEILAALSAGKINEGHTRPLLMLSDRPQEQMTLFKEIMYKKVTVREAEGMARRVAYDRARKKDFAADPELRALEEKLREQLGTRVKIERTEIGGKVLIDFFSNEDLRMLLNLLETNKTKNPNEMLDRHIAEVTTVNVPEGGPDVAVVTESVLVTPVEPPPPPQAQPAEESEDLYSVKNFSI